MKGPVLPLQERAVLLGSIDLSLGKGALLATPGFPRTCTVTTLTYSGRGLEVGQVPDIRLPCKVGKRRPRG
jgi:hypothetical protein